ncbi:MAG: ATP synthase F1 subunit delta [Acutalibacteraceae bacterium]|jgi:F-type H+-transporting ATPase subunit delta
MAEPYKEYAGALFALATKNGKLGEYSAALTEIRKIFDENPEYSLFLSSPACSLSERLAAIDEAFGNRYPEYIVSFLKLLCENGRIKDLPRCIDGFEDLKRFFENCALATVYSAVELTDSQKQKLCERLNKATGKTVQAKYIIDKSLIGGIKVEVDGKTFDSSIQKQFQKIKGVMNG